MYENDIDTNGFDEFLASLPEADLTTTSSPEQVTGAVNNYLSKFSTPAEPPREIGPTNDDMWNARGLRIMYPKDGRTWKDVVGNEVARAHYEDMYADAAESARARDDLYQRAQDMFAESRSKGRTWEDVVDNEVARAHYENMYADAAESARARDDLYQRAQDMFAASRSAPPTWEDAAGNEEAQAYLDHQGARQRLADIREDAYDYRRRWADHQAWKDKEQNDYAQAAEASRAADDQAWKDEEQNNYARLTESTRARDDRGWKANDAKKAEQAVKQAAEESVLTRALPEQSRNFVSSVSGGGELGMTMYDPNYKPGLTLPGTAEHDKQVQRISSVLFGDSPGWQLPKREAIATQPAQKLSPDAQAAQQVVRSIAATNNPMLTPGNRYFNVFAFADYILAMRAKYNMDLMNRFPNSPQALAMYGGRPPMGGDPSAQGSMEQGSMSQGPSNRDLASPKQQGLNSDLSTEMKKYNVIVMEHPYVKGRYIFRADKYGKHFDSPEEAIAFVKEKEGVADAKASTAGIEGSD